MPVGIVVAKHLCYAVGYRNMETMRLTPGAEIAHWVELRTEDSATLYHARTMDLNLYRSDVEAYRVALSMDVPSAFVIMDEDEVGESPGAGR